MGTRNFKFTSSALVLILTFCFNYSNSLTLTEEINYKKSVYNFKEIDLFGFVTADLKEKNLNGSVSQGTILKLNLTAKQTLQRGQENNILLKLRVSEGKVFELMLTKCKVHSDDFVTASISENGTIKNENYQRGLYYRGVLVGDDRSWAALSIFDDYVMAVIATSEGNFNLSQLTQSHDGTYILFNDMDLKDKSNFTCLTSDIDSYSRKGNLNPGNNSVDNYTQGPIKEYIECDYKMYQDFGSNITRVNNYLSAVYNSIIAVYHAEQINTVLQSVYIWTTPDIYASTNSLPVMIKRFGARIKNNFNGNMGLLASTRTNAGGGYAWIDVLCTNYWSVDSSGPYAVTVIDTNLHPYPVYSWVINVMTHEMGHNIGSKHTHSCLWPGGPIDTCYNVEGGCYNGPLKPKVGTIMSYCHLNAGVNLAFGFGPLPGNFIRQRYNNAPCLIGIQQISSEVPEKFELAQNYPNPFNPVTHFGFRIAHFGFVSLKIYDIRGSEISVLVNEELAPGIFEAEWDASDFPSGVYFYKLETEGFTDTKKMVLVK